MSYNTGLFVILESVDSTNNYAMAQVHSGVARHGQAWFAIEQTNGKGRRGKSWSAKKGENLIISIAVNTQFLQTYEQFKLSAAVSLACFDLFKKYDNLNTKIKWPNDLFWNDRKAGGVLIENVLKGNIWQWSVIGIGININQTSFDSENNPVSLKQITGKSFDPVVLAKQLHTHVLKRIDEIRTRDFKKVLDEYNNVLYKKGQKVKLKKGNTVFETVITSVSTFGQLQTLDNMEHSFGFDEIEWIL